LGPGLAVHEVPEDATTKDSMTPVPIFATAHSMVVVVVDAAACVLRRAGKGSILEPAVISPVAA
jgi:hypothetical protein